MSEHTATIRWSRGDRPFDAGYPREHAWSFDSGQTLRASAAPGYGGATDAVDPEEALVAALSGCHMLTFLHVARNAGFVVTGYRDEAVGVMEKTPQDRVAVTRVTLHPEISYEGRRPTEAESRERFRRFRTRN